MGPSTRPELMEWTDEPATWKQLKYLRQLGCKLDHPLTKIEASDLIGKLGGRQEREETPQEKISRQMKERGAAYHLRLSVEDARRMNVGGGQDQIERAQRVLALAIAERQEFWVDSCRGVSKSQAASMQVQELYQKFGCRFIPPTHNDVQYILDALDSAMPLWDRDHPELFFQTLQLNFPQLLRHSA